MTHRRFGLALFAASIALATISAPSAGATTPGYDRVAVKAAGISVLVPDDWSISQITRKEAKELLANNPGLEESGSTVESIVSQPLNAYWSAPGSPYVDRYLELQVLPAAAVAASSLTDFKEMLVRHPLVDDVTVERTRVAGRPALVGRYTIEAVRDDGSTGTSSMQLFAFVGPKGSVLMAFGRSAPDDPAFDQITKTMLRSVRFIK